MMFRKIAAAAALAGLLSAFLSSVVHAGQQVVGTVDQDTFIANDSDTDGLVGTAFTGPEDTTALGPLFNFLQIRGGSGAATSQCSKALIRFQLSQTINPDLPYFLEITTDASDSSSGNTFSAYTITDSAVQAFDENTLTWVNSGAANLNRQTFNAAGTLLASFTFPSSVPDTPVIIPITGAQLQTFVNGPNTYTTVGLTGNNTGAIHIQQLGNPAGHPARIFTFDIIDSAASGDMNAGGTWSSGLPPSAANLYRIVNGHTVTANSTAFNGEGVIVNNGTLEFNANAVVIPKLIVDATGNLTETTTGDFFLGDVGNLKTAVLNGNLTVNAESGGDVGLDTTLSGNGAITVNGTVGTRLFITAANQFGGSVNFNGTGDTVEFLEPSGSNATYNMNSTGTNSVIMGATALTGLGNFTFNQPGSMIHSSAVTRQQTPQNIVLNANVTVDLSQTFTGNERRLFMNSWSGSGNFIVNGTASDPTSGTTTLNEFEIGGTSEPNTVDANTYSGTVTLNNYVNAEIRENTPAAAYVVNQNARLEMGHQIAAAAHDITFGQVSVNSGGILEVGFEQDMTDVPTDGYNEGHHAYHLVLSNADGKSGGLSLANSSTLRMQLNGIAANQFDSILANGNVALGGTLNVLMNPPSTTERQTLADVDPNSRYTPTIGDTFDIITIAPGALPPGDYSANGTVGPEDYQLWRSAFGTNNVATDGNADGVVDAADFVVWRDHLGESGGPSGTITGTFSNVSITDPLGTLTGFNLQVLYSTTKVQIKVVAPGLGVGAAVPEPGTALLTVAGMFAWVLGRSRGWQTR